MGIWFMNASSQTVVARDDGSVNDGLAGSVDLSLANSSLSRRTAHVCHNLWCTVHPGSPRLAASGVFQQGSETLVERIRDDSIGLDVLRPPKGGVRFGEHLAEASERETDEEAEEKIQASHHIATLQDLFIRGDCQPPGLLEVLEKRTTALKRLPLMDSLYAPS